MSANCHFHPDRPATHIFVLLDLANCWEFHVEYKRVSVCQICAWQAHNTHRCEELNIDPKPGPGPALQPE